MSSKSFFARAAQREGRKGKAGLIVKRVRPPMPPLSVRVQVAERQLRNINPTLAASVQYGSKGLPVAVQLKRMLDALRAAMKLPDDAQFALDHDEALILRKYNPRFKDVASRYTPHAHDPAALIYREKADHQQKTTGRRPGAARTVTTHGSDIHLKSKFNRLEGRTKKRPKAKIPQRKNPWPKRKMR